MSSLHEIFLNKCTSKASFAFSRLPFSDNCTFYYQAPSPTVYYDLKALNGKQGFLFAPFVAGEKHPILLFESASCEKIKLSTLDVKRTLKACQAKVIENVYAKAFETFHSALVEKLFDKLVLARCVEIDAPYIDLEKLFLKACQLYPRQHIMLVSTPQSGIWLMATPEILLDKQPANAWQTMALAGTMRNVGRRLEWSEKNKQEHNYVVKYILACLEKYTDRVSVSDPFTAFAADLAHLRTDFSFTLMDENNIGNLLSALHPTPAVCGIPKQKAKEFILANEGIDRSYYSGFAGPLNIKGETHLYVSLRCMEIKDNCYKLYAGGGLLSESNQESEWLETEAKLQTMLQLLQ